MTTRQPPYPRAMRLPLLLAAMLAIQGCKSPQRARVEPPPTPIPPVAQPTTLGFHPPAPPIALPAPRELMPLEPGLVRYIQLPVNDEPRPLVMRIERVASDAAFPIRRHTPDGRIEHLGFHADGSLVIGAVEDLQHQALTRYDPPLPLLPAGLSPAAPLTFTASMTVVNAKDPSQQRDKGSCRVVITHDATQRVTTPMGSFDAHRLTRSYSANLGLAKVATSAQEWYHPSHGLLAEDAREDVQALFLKFSSAHIYLRASPTTPPPAAAQ